MYEIMAIEIEDTGSTVSVDELTLEQQEAAPQALTRLEEMLAEMESICLKHETRPPELDYSSVGPIGQTPPDLPSFMLKQYWYYYSTDYLREEIQLLQAIS
jgi:hypothetical protein